MDENKDAPLQSDQENSDPSDKLTPEHPRFKQVIADLHQYKGENEDLKQQLADLKQKVETRQEKTGEDEMDEGERAALDKIDREFRKRGYMTQEQYEEKTHIDKLANDFLKFTAQYDGKNGYPKFNAEDVAAYAAKKGFEDIEEAYFSMHRPAIIQVEAKKLANNPTPTGSEKPGNGDKSAPVGEFTAEEIAKMSDEDYEKNRGKFLQSIRGK